MKRSQGIAFVELIVALVVFGAAVGIFLQLAVVSARTVEYSTRYVTASGIADQAVQWARGQLRGRPGEALDAGAFRDPRLEALPEGRVELRSSRWPASDSAKGAHRWTKVEVTVSFAHGRRRPTVSAAALVSHVSQTKGSEGEP